MLIMNSVKLRNTERSASPVLCPLECTEIIPSDDEVPLCVACFSSLSPHG